jgi:hypothetical protein
MLLAVDYEFTSRTLVVLRTLSALHLFSFFACRFLYCALLVVSVFLNEVSPIVVCIVYIVLRSYLCYFSCNTKINNETFFEFLLL